MAEIEEEVNPVADAIRKMNNEGAGAMNQKPAAPETPQTPENTEQPPATPPPSNPDGTKTAPSTIKKEAKELPPDPPFVRKSENTENPSAQTPEALAASQEAANKIQAQDLDDSNFYTRLSKLTNGGIKTEKDFVGIMHHYNELQDQAQAGFTPQFASEQAKLAYDLISKASPGTELETAERAIRTLKFDVSKAEPKDLLFAAYRNDPNNSDLTEAQAQKYFEAEYTKKYDNLENDPVQERQHAVEVRKAKEAIAKFQGDFKQSQDVPAQQQEYIAEVEREVGKTMENFGGLRIAANDNPGEDDFINFAIDDDAELARIQSIAAHPEDYYQEFLKSFYDDKGKFDYDSYVRAIAMQQKAPEIAKIAYEQGLQKGRAGFLAEARNASDPKQIDKVGNNGAPAAGKKMTFNETALAAFNAANKR